MSWCLRTISTGFSLGRRRFGKHEVRPIMTRHDAVAPGAGSSGTGWSDDPLSARPIIRASLDLYRAVVWT
jgi:hypothetical protein